MVSVKQRRIHTMLAIAACAAFSFSAQAGFQTLQLDINSMVADAGGPFDGTTHTGEVDFSADGTTSLVSISTDGQGQAVTGSLMNLSGSVMLDNGQVTGGDFSVVLDDGASFTASIVNGEGEVDTQAGQGFQINGATFSGEFQNLAGGSMFAGVDVSPLVGAEPFNGAFIIHSYQPKDGLDNDVNLDLFQFVPTPGGAALFGLAGLAAARRRRR